MILFFLIKFYKLLFFSTLTLGTLMAISSFSWFSMWMGLEINLLSIIPLMNSKINIYPSEASIKYFITQTIASSLILMSIIFNLNILEFIPQNFSMFLMIMMNSGFFMKMGAAPFHFWFPEVMEGLNWNLCLIMLTWQKIAPMILLMNNLKLNLFIILIIIYSSLIGGTQGLNQISLRKILAYSSINHISWMLASMLFSQFTWLIYFTTYALITMNMILLLSKLNIFYLKQLLNSMNQKKSIKIFFSLNFLSLGGLPPFLGFLPKWLTINFLIENNLYILAAILIISTLLTLFFYLRIASNSLMILSSENLSKKIKINPMILILNSVVLMGLLLSNFLISA
uniref:NADH-ubiquinone oxidoreductase chain 2 n=1 Tax=Erotylidae sp. BMNH 1274391 TaxID=1796503 RepID=A0A126TFT7_9CUCU|nr:NADH dehydrogenase subunit 2 [Erotylidae sp. BMNH 1274391]